MDAPIHAHGKNLTVRGKAKQKKKVRPMRKMRSACDLRVAGWIVRDTYVYQVYESNPLPNEVAMWRQRVNFVEASLVEPLQNSETHGKVSELSDTNQY